MIPSALYNSSLLSCIILGTNYTLVHLCFDLFSSGLSSCSFSALRKVGSVLLEIFTFYFYGLTSAYSVNGSCMTHSLHEHKLTSVPLWCALFAMALEDHPEGEIYTNCRGPFNFRNWAGLTKLHLHPSGWANYPFAPDGGSNCWS